MESVVDATVRAERVDYASMVEAIDATGNAFASLLYGLHPEDGERAVPQLTWNVAETAVHMLTIVRRGLGDRRRSETIPGLADLNATCISEFESRMPLEIADALTEDKARLLAVLKAQSAEDAFQRGFPLHAGLRTNVTTALSYMLFDFMAHGLDIARAVGAEWIIDPAHASLGLHAALPALGPWVKSEVLSAPAQQVTIAFPGGDTTTTVQVGDGAYRAHNSDRSHAEEIAEVDPIETFLAIAGRVETSDPTATRLASWFEPI